jgi:hypothetical protein
MAELGMSTFRFFVDKSFRLLLRLKKREISFFPVGSSTEPVDKTIS